MRNQSLSQAPAIYIVTADRSQNLPTQTESSSHPRHLSGVISLSVWLGEVSGSDTGVPTLLFHAYNNYYNQ